MKSSLTSGQRAVVGLGSNVGDRLAMLRAAVAALGDLAPLASLTAVSSLYETKPVGGPPQGDFYNAAVLLGLTSTPGALLGRLLEIERSLGRVRKERFGPRTLDLDILWIDGVTLESPDLTVPHPRLAERAFALMPLLELAPDAIDPRTGHPFPAILDTSGVRRLEDPSRLIP